MSENYGSIFQPQFQEQMVRGRLVRFYSNRVGLLSKLSPFISAIAGAIAILHQPDNSLDTGQENKTVYDPTGKTYELGGRRVPVMRETTDSAPAIKPQLAQLRDSQRQDAIGRVIKQFTDKNTHVTLAELVIDSCKDEEEIQAFKTSPQKMVEKMDVELLTSFVAGLVIANMQGIRDNADPLMRGLARVQAPTPVEEPVSESQPISSGIG